MAVVGGAGSVWGAVVGATVVTLLKIQLQDWLPRLLGRTGNFEIVVFGILMVLLLQRTRDGIWPWLAHLVPGRLRPHVEPRRAKRGRRACAPLRRNRSSIVDKARKEFGGLIAVNDLSFRSAAARFSA